MISSGHIKSGPGTLPDFVFWRTAVNSAAVKSPKILTSVAVSALQRSDTFFDMSLVDSRLASSYFPFLRSCAAMAFAEWDNDGKSALTCL